VNVDSLKKNYLTDDEMGMTNSELFKKAKNLETQAKEI